MISEEQLKEWRKLCEEATPGEWVGFAGCIQFIDPEDCTPERRLQRDVKKRHLVGVNGPDCKTAPEGANSKFISASRKALPALLDEIEQLRDALQRIVDYKESDSDDDEVNEIVRAARAALESKC